MCFACATLGEAARRVLHGDHGRAVNDTPGAATDPFAGTQTPTNSGTPTGGANPYIDSLIFGQARWTTSAADPIRYFFGSGNAPDPFGSGTLAAAAWTAEERAAFAGALGQFSAVANLFFAEAASQAQADMVEWKVPHLGSAGLHNLPAGAPVPLNGWFDPTGGYWADFSPGSFSYNLFLHEVGHGMGLAHPHDGGSRPDATVFPGVTPGDSWDIGDFGLNQGIWTVMSYRDGWIEEPNFPDGYGHAMTLMAFDVAALQLLYGANTSYRTGNDTYVLPTAAGPGTGWSCIWDAGGIDTISHQGGAGAARIDLRQAPLLGPNAGGFVSWVKGVPGGFTIANGAVVENAVGGEAADLITGNQVANTLSGGGGGDLINGGSGDDILNGGAGADLLVGDFLSAPLPVGIGFGSGLVVVPRTAANNEIDTAINLSNTFSLAADPDIADATTIAHTTVQGTGNGQRAVYRIDVTTPGATIVVDVDHTSADFDSEIELYAADGITRLAYAGDSPVDAGAGGSTREADSFLTYRSVTAGTFYVLVHDVYGFYILPDGATYELNISVAGYGAPQESDGGSSGNDVLNGEGGDDSLYGGLGNDSLNGGEGNDFLDGGAGADIMAGGTGNDTYRVDHADDRIVEAVGGGTDVVTALVSYTLAPNQEIEFLQTAGIGTAAAINLTGNNLANTIFGNNGSNVLNGGGLNDVLRGYGGNDTYLVDHAADQVIEAVGGGHDTVMANTNWVLAAGQEVEVLSTYGVSTTARVFLTGNEFSQTLLGNNGVNLLNGAGGADIMIGYGGWDTYYVDRQADQVIEAVGGGSEDRIFCSVSYFLAGGQEVEILQTLGVSTTAAIDLTGNEFAQTLYGNAGANILNGRLGNDVLWGFAGNDTFFFNTALGPSNVDTIVDFFAPHDTIALDKAIFTQLGGRGVLNAEFLRIGAAAADANDRIIYDSATGALSYDADGSGAGAAIRFAQLSAGLALTNADFFVV